MEQVQCTFSTLRAVRLAPLGLVPVTPLGGFAIVEQSGTFETTRQGDM